MEFQGNIELKIYVNPTDTTDSIEKKLKDTITKEFPGAEIDFVNSTIHDDVGLVNRIVMLAEMALNTYSSENVDVVVNEETGCLYVAYHSDNNSFPLSEDICHKENVDLGELESALDKLHIGHCW